MTKISTSFPLINKNKKVLIFIAHYLPGYKIGGPVNSVSNIVKALKDYYNFFVITSDRDMGDREAYKDINTNEWINVDDASVIYLKPNLKYYWNCYRHLKENAYDIVYLNSIFEYKFSIYILLINYFGLIRLNKVIIAPRGEFFDEALSFGRSKKFFFLRLAKFFGIYKNVIFHSTADIETLTINKNMPNAKIRLARVLADNSSTIHEIPNPDFTLKEDNVLKIIFLSRISKEKNLIYALQILLQVSCLVELHIYGPMEDTKIWEDCLKTMQELPSNVVVQYKGMVEKKFVKSFFSKYDLFFFPTLLENYGHVINESLSVGTPVLISNNTPWQGLEEKGLGWDFNLKNNENFLKVLNFYFNKSTTEKLFFREKVLKSYSELIKKNNLKLENINLFT